MARKITLRLAGAAVLCAGLGVLYFIVAWQNADPFRFRFFAGPAAADGSATWRVEARNVSAHPVRFVRGFISERDLASSFPIESGPLHSPLFAHREPVIATFPTRQGDPFFAGSSTYLMVLPGQSIDIICPARDFTSFAGGTPRHLSYIWQSPGEPTYCAICQWLTKRLPVERLRWVPWPPKRHEELVMPIILEGESKTP